MGNENWSVKKSGVKLHRLTELNESKVGRENESSSATKTGYKCYLLHIVARFILMCTGDG